MEIINLKISTYKKRSKIGGIYKSDKYTYKKLVEIKCDLRRC